MAPRWVTPIHRGLSGGSITPTAPQGSCHGLSPLVALQVPSRWVRPRSPAPHCAPQTPPCWGVCSTQGHALIPEFCPWEAGKCIHHPCGSLSPARPQPIKPLEIFAPGSAPLPALDPHPRFSKPPLWSWTKGRGLGQGHRSPLLSVGHRDTLTGHCGGWAPRGVHNQGTGAVPTSGFPRLDLGCHKPPAKSNTGLEHPPSIPKPSKDLAAQAGSPGPLESPMPGTALCQRRGGVGTNRSRFLREQLPRTWICSRSATLQRPCQPWHHGHRRQRGQVPVPLCPPPAAPHTPSSACSELSSLWSSSGARGRLPRATAEQPQSPACVRFGQHPAEPWQPGIFFRGGRCSGSPGVPCVPTGDTELPGTPGTS